MSTESFEKDFISNRQTSSLIEKALAYFENRKIEWTLVPHRRLKGEELQKFLESLK